jgi:hypothetical protein
VAGAGAGAGGLGGVLVGRASPGPHTRATHAPHVRPRRTFRYTLSAKNGFSKRESTLAFREKASTTNGFGSGTDCCG